MNRLVNFMVLLAVMVPGWLTTVSGQGTQPKITLGVKDAQLVTVLEELQRQSGMNFIYNERIVKDVNNITLNVKDTPLDQVMKEVLKGTNLQYEIHEKIIVITEKDSKGASKGKDVNGVVVDDKNEPIPGVSVLIKGTGTGVATDLDGRFKLQVPAGTANLLFSFVGMKTQEMAIPADGKEMRVKMVPQADELDEVVITGYVQTTKRKATGSVATLGPEVFANQAQPSVDNLLQGQVAGVSVMATTGRPGQASKIRIRGTNSLSGDASPLWVIDGVPMQRTVTSIETDQIKAGDFDNIFVNGIGGVNPNDIENVTILKDASATAIYGSRAAGGVIVVTTKRGKAGKMRVNYSANLSIDMKPQRDANLMNSPEKLAWEQELWDEFSAPNFGQKDKWSPVVGIVGMIRAGKEMFKGMSVEEQDAYIRDLSKTSTNWFDELFRNAVSTNHHLSFSGGAEKVTYYVALGLTSNNGLVKRSAYDRYNLNTNLVIMPHDRVKLELGFDLAQQKSKGASLRVDPFKYAYYANPYEKLYNEDGSYRPDYTYFVLSQANDGTAEKLPANGFNIMREINETSSKVDNLSITLRLNLDYTITSKLKFSGLGSYGFVNNRSDNILGQNTYAAYTDRFIFDKGKTDKLYGSITQTALNNYNYNVRGHFVFTDELWTDHQITVLAGSELRGEKMKSIYEKRYGYDDVTGNSSIPLPSKPENSNSVDYSVLQDYAAMIDGLSGEEEIENRFASFYASLDYYYTNKYILSASFRTDGSNNFGSDEQFNPTWSLGAAWHIGEEHFMSSLKPVLSRLTLRVAGGYTGNVNKGTSPELVMQYASEYRKIGSELLRIGTVKNAPNPKLRWEKTRDMKVALDFGLFDERLTGLFEAYHRLSVDAVTDVRVLTTTGFFTQKYNTSKIRNTGIETTLNGLILDKRDWKVNASFNIAWNWNKVLKYNNPTGQIDGNTFEGYPVSSIFNGKEIGIDPEYGLYKYQLRPDAVINNASDIDRPDNYRYYLGTTIAPVTGGFSASCTYKGFRIGIGGNYSLGAKRLDLMKSPASYTNVYTTSGNRESLQTVRNDLYGNHLNVRKDAVDRWTVNRTTGVKNPRIIDYYGQKLFLNEYNPTHPEIIRGAYLENISFLRIRNVTLTYNFNPQMLTKLRLSSLGVSCAVNNVLTFTKYEGIDPETPGAVYPLTRSVTFGLNLGF